MKVSVTARNLSDAVKIERKLWALGLSTDRSRVTASDRQLILVHNTSLGQVNAAVEGFEVKVQEA